MYEEASPALTFATSSCVVIPHERDTGRLAARCSLNSADSHPAVYAAGRVHLIW